MTIYTVLPEKAYNMKELIIIKYNGENLKQRRKSCQFYTDRLYSSIKWHDDCARKYPNDFEVDIVQHTKNLW